MGAGTAVVRGELDSFMERWFTTHPKDAVANGPQLGPQGHLCQDYFGGGGMILSHIV